jgi:hypothetical protein
MAGNMLCANGVEFQVMWKKCTSSKLCTGREFFEMEKFSWAFYTTTYPLLKSLKLRSQRRAVWIYRHGKVFEAGELAVTWLSADITEMNTIYGAQQVYKYRMSALEASLANDKRPTVQT